MIAPPVSTEVTNFESSGLEVISKKVESGFLNIASDSPVARECNPAEPSANVSTNAVPLELYFPANIPVTVAFRGRISAWTVGTPSFQNVAESEACFV